MVKVIDTVGTRFSASSNSVPVKLIDCTIAITINYQLSIKGVI